eukprot:scaffold5043_cov115-Isochrysis_galbana.AAC.2
MGCLTASPARLGGAALGRRRGPTPRQHQPHPNHPLAPPLRYLARWSPTLEELGRADRNHIRPPRAKIDAQTRRVQTRPFHPDHRAALRRPASHGHVQKLRRAGCRGPEAAARNRRGRSATEGLVTRRGEPRASPARLGDCNLGGCRLGGCRLGDCQLGDGHFGDVGERGGGAAAILDAVRPGGSGSAGPEDRRAAPRGGVGEVVGGRMAEGMGGGVAGGGRGVLARPPRDSNRRLSPDASQRTPPWTASAAHSSNAAAEQKPSACSSRPAQQSPPPPTGIEPGGRGRAEEVAASAPAAESAPAGLTASSTEPCPIPARSSPDSSTIPAPTLCEIELLPPPRTATEASPGHATGAGPAAAAIFGFKSACFHRGGFFMRRSAFSPSDSVWKLFLSSMGSDEAAPPKCRPSAAEKSEKASTYALHAAACPAMDDGRFRLSALGFVSMTKSANSTSKPSSAPSDGIAASQARDAAGAAGGAGQKEKSAAPGPRGTAVGWPDQKEKPAAVGSAAAPAPEQPKSASAPEPAGKDQPPFLGLRQWGAKPKASAMPTPLATPVATPPIGLTPPRSASGTTSPVERCSSATRHWSRADAGGAPSTRSRGGGWIALRHTCSRRQGVTSSSPHSTESIGYKVPQRNANGAAATPALPMPIRPTPSVRRLSRWE